jgi:hypothetical protein
MGMHPKLKKHGEDVAAKVSSATKNSITPNPSWINSVSYLGGVYVIWKKLSESWIPIYVGESSNLKDRLDEMTRLGRHYALWKLTDREGIKIRNVSILELPEIKGLKVSHVVLPIGRKEAEDYLISLWRKHLINKHDKRFQRRSDWGDFEALQKGK